MSLPSWRTIQIHRPMLLSLSITLVLLTGCSVEEVIGTYRDGVPEVSPTAIASLPDDIEEATLVVTDGRFGVDEIRLLEGAPTVLHISNNDARDYRFRIGEDLVAATSIPADTTTDIEFTTPNAGVYEGQLFSSAADEVFDTVRVIVRSAGGVEP